MILSKLLVHSYKQQQADRPSSPWDETVVNLIPLGLTNSLLARGDTSGCASVPDSVSAAKAAYALPVSAVSLASLPADCPRKNHNKNKVQQLIEFMSIW